MHPQLQAVIADFEQAQGRLRELAHAVPAESWATRPDPGRWSVGECVAHLNLTSAAFVPLLRDALARARQTGEPARGRYRRDLVGWMLWRGAGPPVRFRTKTAAPFVPRGDDAPAALITEFDRLQHEQIACVREGDGLPLNRVKITSPFDARIHYNLYACMTILPRHQHRHLWQAEQVWRAMQMGQESGQSNGHSVRRQS